MHKHRRNSRHVIRWYRPIQKRAQRDVELNKTAASISDLIELFGRAAARKGLSTSKTLDIYEKAYEDATLAKPWWSRLTPDTGWMVAAFLLVLFILHDMLKENFTQFLKWLITLAYNRLAGYRRFGWIALSHYRKALVARYRELNIPFRPGRPLNMTEVYVPLKAAETGDTELLDAYQAIGQYRRLMAVGAPGSGKSMLLRHIALTYARDERANLPMQAIPILIELNRLNDSAITLQDLLVKTLAQNNFPRAANFIKAGFKSGLLLLLFDGLDEVNSAARERVVNQIKDMLNTHPHSRAAITCRTAVYKEEFGDSTDQKLEIVEFSDQQIQRFLSSWEADLPPGKSVENLLRNLYERPRIMALARNPLLLTIIAYLYADTEFVLPHSRAEFYDESITVLLRQWKKERNHYKSAHKQLVLQHLALFNQDSVQQGGRDRRSIDLPTALAEINKVLPSLTLTDEDALPILDEIVERSGLLISIDGGLIYQFAHLTLQEFFAARALEGDVDGLIARFKDDPDAWRETAKLWCGLAHDSTQLIGKIYEMDAITAFECLGDAQKVDANFVNKIVTAFKVRLGKDGDEGESIMRAFAVVATDPSTRGQKILKFLSSTVVDSSSTSKRRLAAANALALTNLPQAVEILAEYAPDHPEVQPLLAQMGDLAVPILEKWTGKGQGWAFDTLQTIGTPRAARVLTSFLWNADKTLQHRTAWHLATLLPKSNIEASLSDYVLKSNQQSADYLDWIWEPFSANKALQIIVGRIAHLLHTAPTNIIPVASSPAPDVRLVIPLCTVAAREGKLKTLEEDERKRIKNEIEQEKPAMPSSGDFSDDPGWRYLFDRLSASLQVGLVRCLIRENPQPNRNDWRNVFRPVAYEFETSWESKGIRTMLAVLCSLSLWEAGNIMINSPQLLSWGNGLAVVVGLILICVLLILRDIQFNLAGAAVAASIGVLLLGGMIANVLNVTDDETTVVVIVGVIVGRIRGRIHGVFFGGLVGEKYVIIVGGIVGGIRRVNGDGVGDKIGTLIHEVLFGVIIGIIFSVIFGGIVGEIGSQALYFPTILFNLWGWVGVTALCLVWMIGYGLLWWHGARRQR